MVTLRELQPTGQAVLPTKARCACDGSAAGGLGPPFQGEQYGLILIA